MYVPCVLVVIMMILGESASQKVTLPSLSTVAGKAYNWKCTVTGLKSYRFKKMEHYRGETFIRYVDAVQGKGSASNTLTLSSFPVTYEDTGTYICTVENTTVKATNDQVEGELFTATSTFRVYSNPQISGPKERTIFAEINKPLTLNIPFTSYPKHKSHRWALNGKVLEKSGTNFISTVIPRQVIMTVQGKTFNTSGFELRLFINTVRKEDLGHYQGSVCSDHGCTTTVVKLNAEGPPHKPTMFKVEAATTADVWLSWKSPFNGGSEQTFNLEYQEDGGSSWHTREVVDPGEGCIVYAMISDLSSGTSYSFRVRGGNRHVENKGAYTDELKTETKASDLGFGPGIGVGVAITVVLVCIIAVGVFIAMKKRGMFDSHKKDKRAVGKTNPAHQNPANTGYAGVGNQQGEEGDYERITSEHPGYLTVKSTSDHSR